MPNKRADLGPSPNSLDDNGNVSFESHSANPLVLSNGIKDNSSTVFKGSGQSEIPGQSQIGQFENETVVQLNLNQLLEFEQDKTNDQKQKKTFQLNEFKSNNTKMFNNYTNTQNQTQLVDSNQNDDIRKKGGTKGPRSDTASNHQKKPSKSVVKYVSALPPTGLKTKEGLTISIQTPRSKLTTVVSNKILERVESASSQTRQNQSGIKSNQEKIKIEEEQATEPGQFKPQNSQRSFEEKAVFNLLTSRSKQSFTAHSNQTTDLRTIEAQKSIQPFSSFLQRSKEQILNLNGSETVPAKNNSRIEITQPPIQTLKASELQQQLQALGSPARYSPSTKHQKVARNKSTISGSSKQASHRATPNQSSILNQRKVSPYQKTQHFPFTDRQAQKIFVQLQLPNLWKTNLNNQTYSKFEMCEVALKVSNLIREHENMLQYERQKVAEIRNERDQLAIQMEQQIKNQQLNTSNYNTATLESALRIQSECLKNCYDALRDSMIHNFSFLEFYKDLQSYISQNFFREEGSPANQHLHYINNLMHEEHALQNMQINSDTLENLRESVENSLKQEVCLLNSKVQSLHNSLESSTPMKIVDLQPTPVNQYSHNRHVNCCQNDRQLPADSIILSNMFKQEIQALKIQIFKLKEDKENLRRKNIELKQKVQNFGDKNYQKHQEFLIKLEIEKHQAEINEINSRQRQAELELTIFKDEKFSLRKQNQQLKETIQVIQQQKEEFQKLLVSKEDFKALEDTVSQLTSLVISKNVRDLSAQQKTTLKTIFGDTSILHTLKQSLAESEQENLALKQILCQYQTSTIKIDKLFKTWQVECEKILRLAKEDSIADQTNKIDILQRKRNYESEWLEIESKIQNELQQLDQLREYVQNLNIMQVQVHDATQTLSDMTDILSNIKSKSILQQHNTQSNSKVDSKTNKFSNNISFPVFQTSKNEPIVSLKSPDLPYQLLRFRSSASLSPGNKNYSKEKKLSNCKSAEMFETTPTILKMHHKVVDNNQQTQKQQKNLDQNQSIQSLLESVVMPEIQTNEKNLDELDNSLLDFVRGDTQQDLTKNPQITPSDNPPIFIAGIFKEAESELEILKSRGKKRRPAGKSQNQTSRRTHVSGDLLNRQNDYLKQQLKINNKEFSSQEFDLLND